MELQQLLKTKKELYQDLIEGILLSTFQVVMAYLALATIDYIWAASLQ